MYHVLKMCLIRLYIVSLKDSSEPANEETDLDAELAQLERKDKPKQFTRLDLVFELPARFTCRG